MIDVQALFKPLTIGSLTLPNRLVMAPMTRCQSPSYGADERGLAHYTARARGGIGLIISEGSPVNDSGHGYPNVPSFYGEQSLKGWKAIADGVHQTQAKMFAQLWHVGSVRRNGQPPNTQAPSLAPSHIIHPLQLEQGSNTFGAPTVPQAMTQHDIDQTIQDFAIAAKQAQLCGFDGIEIHGAHSYLIDQFFWSKTNTRSDRYNGKTLDQRNRIAIEIVQAVRQQVGPDFPISFRMSLWKLGDYHANEAETPHILERFVTPIRDAGVNLFHCSMRRFDQPIFKDSPLTFAGWVKKLTDTPTIAVGSIGLNWAYKDSFTSDSCELHLDRVLTRLETQEFDLAAIGRPLLSDPNWAEKVKHQDFKSIIPFETKYLPY